MPEIYAFLKEHNIPYQRFTHQSVNTIEDLGKLPEMHAAITKNLFLRDKSGKFLLATVGIHKSVDLKKLGDTIDRKKLSFASPDELMGYLGVESGATTLLGLIHDTHHAVDVLIDRTLWEQNESIQCHPLTSSESLTLSKNAFQRFFEMTGHQPRILDIPERQQV